MDDPPIQDPPIEDPTEHLVPGAARDIQLIAQKAVLGFRVEGGAYHAGYTTHDVTVRDGVAELIPHHVDASGTQITGGAIGVETGGITRSDGTIVGGGGSVRSNADGAVEIVRGGAVEVLTNREDGIQQEWKFASAPAGDGDLTVEVQISGQKLIASNDSGLHFKSSAGLGFRYSHALWLDAAGHEWPIQAIWHDDRISMTVPAEVLGETQFPATLDPTITGESAVDTQVIGSTGVSSTSPAIAFDGTNYLVVWADQRLSRDEDIFATRVSQTGAILNSVGITVAATPGRQLNPTVAFTGTQYVVAWEDFKTSAGTESDIAAATVSTAGVVGPITQVATTNQSELTPRLASNGSNALVVWTSAGDIRAALFNGTAFGGTLSVTADAAVQGTPNVGARPGGNYLVAYSEGADTSADLRGIFITPAGAKSGAAFTISAATGRQYNPAVAFDGSNYVVAFTNNNAGINQYATRVSAAGVALDTRTEGAATVGGVAVSTATGNQELEGLTCITGACIVVWQDSRNLQTTSFDVYAQRLAIGEGLTNDGPEIIISALNRGQFVPAVTTNGSGYFVTWQDNRDGNTQTVFGARVTAAGAVTDASGVMLVTSNNRETTPVVGRAGSTFGVVWADSRSYGTDIELIRFAGASKLDATARPVSNATFAQSSPAVTASAGNFYVVWNDTRSGVDRDIYGARVSATGAVLDSAGTAISTATGDQLVPRVASSSAVTLIVWQDRRSGNFDILGALVNNTTGAVIASDIEICTVVGDQGRPAVAWDGVSGQFFVVWNDSRDNADPNIFGTRVTPEGDVLEPNGAMISGAGNGQFAPAVAFLNGTGLVAWEDRRDDTGGDIFGTRVALGAALFVREPSGIPISSTAGSQNAVTVASLNGSFLVAWTDGRNINTTSTDIFGQQVGISGTLNGPDFAIATGPETEEQPSLSDSTTGGTYIAYSKTRNDLQTVRIATRTITVSAGTGQSCSTNAQCSTGACVDNRCCDSVCGDNSQTDCQACAASKTGQPDGTCAVIPGPGRTICRNYASTICDNREYCDGVSAECPEDTGRNQGQVCNTTTGAVCPSNAAPGPHGCP